MRMARKWSGFLAQNQSTKEEWELLESCEAEAKRAQHRALGPDKREHSAIVPSQPKQRRRAR